MATISPTSAVSAVDMKSTTLTEARSAHKKPTLDQAGKAFEAMFFQTIMKEMHNSKLADGLLDGENEKPFQSMLDQAYADLASKRMDLGISAAITRALGTSVRGQNGK